MFTKKIESIKDQTISMYEDGSTKADVARFIQSKTDLKWSQSKEWARRIFDEYESINSLEDDSTPQEIAVPENEGDLEFSDKYVYVKDADNYIFLLHNIIGKNFVISGAKIRSLVKNYSNFDGETASINEVSIKYKIPRNVVIQILKILGITHDSLPVTMEDITSRTEKDIIDECLQDKKFSIYQKLQQKDWIQTKEDAKKWNALQAGKLDPISSYLDNWEPPEQKYSVAYKHLGDYKFSSPKKTFLTVLTDNHIGEFTKGTFNGTKYNTKQAIQNIFNYLNQIESKVSERKYNFDKCVLVCLGDLLNSCLDGKTRKGTVVENDIINEDLFDVGLDVLVSFIEGLKSIFGKVEIQCTKGNHDSILVYAIYSACKKYFQNDEKIDFNISQLFIDKFRIHNNYFIFTHGGHDTLKFGIPKDRGAKLEAFFQNFLLKDIKMLDGVKGKYVLSGHTHSFEYLEKSNFEFIVCSASVPSNEYAEVLGYTNIVRQQSFIVGEDYIEEVLNFYL